MPHNQEEELARPWDHVSVPGAPNVGRINLVEQRTHPIAETVQYAVLAPTKYRSIGSRRGRNNPGTHEASATADPDVMQGPAVLGVKGFGGVSVMLCSPWRLT